MSTVEAFSVAASIVSIFLALFAIWFAITQRKESEAAYQQTREVLAKLETVMESAKLTVMESAKLLVSEELPEPAQECNRAASADGEGLEAADHARGADE